MIRKHNKEGPGLSGPSLLPAQAYYWVIPYNALQKGHF